MPQKVVKFTGINRRVNEFQGTGACEELINLRPEVGGGLRVVKPKVVTKENVQYVKVYEHAWGDTYNQIGVERYGNVDWIKSDGSVVEIANHYTTGEVSISSAGNVLVIYYEETKEQYVYKFENDTYKSFNLLINNIIDSSIVYSFSSSSSAELAPQNSATADSDTAGAYNAALYSAASEFNNKYPNGLCGAAVIGCTYELEDGSEVWSTNFIVANVARCNG